MIGNTNNKIFNNIEYNKLYIDNHKYKVKVIDYDGTIIDIQNLNNGQEYTLPQAPSHTGLTFQAWSSSQTITNNKITINDNDVIIGPVYTTTSEQSEFDIELTVSTGLIVTLNMSGTKDWGDGSSDTTTSHTYSNYGNYTITCNGTTINSTTSTSGLFGQSSSNINYYVKNIRLTNISNIPDYSFQYCYSLNTIILSNNITNLGIYTFQYCCALTNVIIPNNITGIGNYVFQYCYSLKNIVLSNSVTNTGKYTFYYNYTLKYIIFPDNFSSIGEDCFQYCTSLIKVFIPNSVTNIGSNAFQYCYSLKSIRLPDNLPKINSFICSNCTSLTNVSIPGTVTSLDMYAFSDCYSLIYADFNQHTFVPSADSSVFGYDKINKICKIKVPFNLYNTWITTSKWSNMANYIDGGDPAIFNFNILSGNPDIYVNDNLIVNTTFDYRDVTLSYYAYDSISNTLLPSTTITGITEGSIHNINIDLSSASKISLNIGITGLDVKYYINNYVFTATEDNGNYYMNIVGSGVNIYYNIAGNSNYMDEDGIIITNGSNITESITLTPATTSTWVRPNLTANGTLGGNSFAVSAAVWSSNYPAWRAVDSNTSTSYYWRSDSAGTVKEYTFYSPTNIKVTKLTYKYTNTSYIAKEINIQGSNDGIAWLNIESTYSGSSTTYTSVLNNNRYFKYYKLGFIPNNSHIRIYDMLITATEKTAAI